MPIHPGSESTPPPDERGGRRVAGRRLGPGDPRAVLRLCVCVCARARAHGPAAESSGAEEGRKQERLGPETRIKDSDERLG